MLGSGRNDSPAPTLRWNGLESCLRRGTPVSRADGASAEDGLDAAPFRQAAKAVARSLQTAARRVVTRVHVAGVNVAAVRADRRRTCEAEGGSGRRIRGIEFADRGPWGELGDDVFEPVAADAIGEAVLAIKTRTPLDVLADTIRGPTGSTRVPFPRCGCAGYRAALSMKTIGGQAPACACPVTSKP